MRTLMKTIWGLLVDDILLASILMISLILGCIVSVASSSRIGAYLIWGGLIVSLWVSIEHQLRLKSKK